MAKKIRFPLALAEGAQVRSLEELRKHFDLEAVLGYYKNGRLLTWLEDRYLEGEAKAIRALNEAAPDFQLRLCEILGSEYSGTDEDLETIRNFDSLDDKFRLDKPFSQSYTAKCSDIIRIVFTLLPGFLERDWKSCIAYRCTPRTSCSWSKSA